MTATLELRQINGMAKLKKARMSLKGQERKFSKQAQRVRFSPGSRRKSRHRFMSASGQEQKSPFGDGAT
jgi:hypothetical protein